MSLYMESTKIEAEKTVYEVAALLREAGARKVLHEYDGNGAIAKLSFTMDIGSGIEAPFELPVRRDPVYTLLNRQRAPRNRQRFEEHDREQAERVAWRLCLRWLQAQVAFIETRMVEPAEVFMPYLKLGHEKTLYSHMRESGFKALPFTEGKNGQS